MSCGLLLIGGLRLLGVLVSKQRFILSDAESVKACYNALFQAPADGSVAVTIAPAGGKRQAQRGLQWMRYQDISRAGVGRDDFASPEGVHLWCKWQWCRPILIADDPFLADLLTGFREAHKNDDDAGAAALRWFTDHHISTEKLNVSQMSEYLSGIAGYFGPMVSLTNPNDYGLEVKKL